MPHTTKTSNMLFVFNPIMKSCHSNKKANLKIVMWLMTSSPCIWHGEIFYGKCHGLTFFYIWNWQSYKAYKKNCLKGFWDNFYDNYNLLLSWLLLLLLKGQLNSSFLIRLRRDTIAHRLRFDQLSFCAGKKWHTGVILTSFRGLYKVLLHGKKSSANLCSTEKSFTSKSD